MRLRRVSHITEKLAALGDRVVSEPEKLKGKWREKFESNYPLHLELGTGKGTFLARMAEKNPQINYIGLERVPDIIYRAALKNEVARLPNLRLVLADAEHLACYFQANEVDRIYLNFSDPWPKKRHAKRRITHPRFLLVYRHILKEGGEIFLKTDNLDFFEFSLLSLAASGFSLQKITYDLHAGLSENIMTEYEQKFASEGKPICRCEAISPK